MAFTKQVCGETGTWSGRCGHPAIVVHEGERFPDCAGCRRGIDWHLVDDTNDARGRRAREQSTFAEAEGWWPGKEPETASSEYWA